MGIYLIYTSGMPKHHSLKINKSRLQSLHAILFIVIAFKYNGILEVGFEIKNSLPS